MNDYEFKPFNNPKVETSTNNNHCPVCGKNWNHGHGHDNCFKPTPVDGELIGLSIVVAVGILYYYLKEKFKK